MSGIPCRILIFTIFSLFLFSQQSSICRAAIHYGIIDNDGGWVDITRQGRKHYFIKSNRNGVQTVG